MIQLPPLCHALLNGPPEREDLRVAEALLERTLSEASGASDIPEFGLPWRQDRVASAIPEPPLSFSLRASAPVMLLDSVWLARVAQSATGHEARAPLLRLYCDRVGLEDPAASLARRFRARLTQEGVHLPPLASPLFFLEPLFPASTLHFAAWHLVLMHRALRFFPELLGYTLAHVYRIPKEWEDFVTPSMQDHHRAMALESLRAGLAEGLPKDRIEAGWALYVAAFRSMEQDVRAAALVRCTREARMAAIVRSKLPEAIGYHAKVRVKEKSLDAWLSEYAERPETVLQALRDSPRVDTICPEGSRFIRAMTFGGPMFGVFDANEREAALAWIENPAAPVPVADITPGPALESVGPCLPCSGAVHARPSPQTSRRWYLALLRCESPADIPVGAEGLVTRVLNRARWLGKLGMARPGRFYYSPAAFGQFIDQQHRKELERYRPLTAPPRVDRDFCRWALLQLAPAILVDGTWLAGIPSAAERLDETRCHLVKIYADELGYGRAEWNHPNVYRRLLASLGLDLPASDTEEFARHPAFVDAAFDLPVYLMAIGLMNDHYFPELLGLNLAIELSGLGAPYLRAIDILRHHGMDPTILQLHLSIDNLASGHAARARNAIELYLEEIRQREGPVAMRAAWDRIWQGYNTLRLASLSITLSIAGRYGLHRLGLKISPQIESGSANTSSGAS